MDNKKTYIYGAGIMGKGTAKELKINDVQVDAFLVSDLTNNADEIEGLPVICVRDAVISRDDTIIIAVSPKYLEEVKATIRQENIHCNIIEDFIGYAWQGRKAALYSAITGSSEDDSYKVESRLGYVGLKQINNRGDVCHFRALLDENVYDLDCCRKIDLLESFEKVYGTYNAVNALNAEKQDSNLYVKVLMACCHKDKITDEHISDSYIVPIQVGKALTDKTICDLQDDRGVNISDRNGNYSECTALYWAWKNRWGIDLDYIGLCHYRRKIDISAEALKALKLNNVDIVLTAPTFIADIKKHFTSCTGNFEDWLIMKEGVQTACPEYADAFEIYENQHMSCQCNISIMRRDIFDEYCSFMFGVLGYVESYYESRNARNDRYLGYLAENLTSVFAIKHKAEYRFAYGDMLVME